MKDYETEVASKVLSCVFLRDGKVILWHEVCR